MIDDPLNLKPAFDAACNTFASVMKSYCATMLAQLAPYVFQTLIHHDGQICRAHLIAGENNHGFFEVYLMKPVKMSAVRVALHTFSLS